MESSDVEAGAVAYLTSQYPAISHTFIRREVTALRRLGVQVSTFSVRPAPPEELLGAEDRVAAAETFSILAQPLVRIASAHLSTIGSAPLAYLKTLALAVRHRPPGLVGLLLAFAHFAESVVLARELRARSVRHLHNHFANSAATVGLLCSRLMNIGWSFTIHGISETDYPAGLLLPAKIAAADRIICASWFGRAQAMRLVPRDQWSKFQVIRCGVSFQDLEEPKPAPRSKIIICVGRLSAEKGQAGLIEAFARVRAGLPDARLRLVGDGPARADLEELAQSLGLEGAVEFMGSRSEADTRTAIAEARILVLPSFMEGLPVVLMEAMALGVPAIASRVAGIPELIRDGENGLLFTASDWDGLAEQMARLIKDPELQLRLSNAGRESVRSGFDVDRSAALLRDCFENLVGRNGQSLRPAAERRSGGSPRP